MTRRRLMHDLPLLVFFLACCAFVTSLVEHEWDVAAIHGVLALCWGMFAWYRWREPV